MNTLSLLVTVLVLVLVLGMQIQIGDMNKKVDELLGIKGKQKK